LSNQSIPLRPNEVNFADARYAFSEADASGSVVLLRSGDISAAASVDIHSVDGTAISPDDYQAIMTTINFAAGESASSIEILPVDNSLEAADKSFTLVLTQNINVNLGARGQLVVTLSDDDGPAQQEALLGGSSIGLGELVLLGFFWLARRVRA
jgi:hypothetical protein